MTPLYRVQDWRGRGPYAPGITDQWTDEDHDLRNPSTLAEFGLDGMRRFPPGTIAGSFLVDLAHVGRWFSAGECKLLGILGYRVARLDGATVYARGMLQVMAWRRDPFRLCQWIPWEAVEHGNAPAAASPARLGSGSPYPDRWD